MSDMDEMRKEAQAALERRGATITPYRLNNMLKTAGRIMDTMLKGDIGVTYAECLAILEIVRSSITRAAGEEEKQWESRC